jgi:hypothetical protein
MNSLRFHVTWLACVSHDFLLRRLVSFIFTLDLVIIILYCDSFRNSFLGHVNALIDMFALILRFFQLRTGLSLWLYHPQFYRLLHILLLFTYVAPNG